MEALQKKLQREEAILLSLSKLDYLSRSQLQKLHGLSGDRNANRVLNNIKPFVSSFRGDTGEYIYYLSKAGRERVGCETVRSKTNQAAHYLMRNDAYIRFLPIEWENEKKHTVTHAEGKFILIPDATFRFNQMRHFLEVDHLQHMFKNREKIERYKKLKETKVLQNKYHYFPRLMWVTLSQSRKRQLEELCEGLETVVHLWDEIK